jgi:formylglycine-generating enzyme required for sulfatase activity
MERAEALRREFEYAREQTDSLFGLISPESLYQRPVAERHRLVFYLGHFDTFDWNLLARRGMGERGFHPEFDRLFERGIDPPPGKAPADTVSDWPRRNEIERYNRLTREWIDSHLDEIDPHLAQMAIEHRLMHAETFAYLLHNLPYEQKRGGSKPEASRRNAPVNPLVRLAGGTVTLGAPRQRFGWDNEYLAHEVTVPEFAIMKYKISNGEYLRFVNQGGPEPHFWVRKGDEWLYRGMFAKTPLPLAHPAWVTWKQAAAYAEWRGMSLPTEAQFQLAASATAPDPERDNFGFHRWDPIAVDAANGGSYASQMIGNGWEWTRDAFAPFEGFEAHPFYAGYSADFFDGNHYVLKGASPRTARRLTRAAFRNWFRPEYPHMYAGFRLVEG